MIKHSPLRLIQHAGRATFLSFFAVTLSGCVSLIDPTLGVNVCSAIPGIASSYQAQYSPDGTRIVFASKSALDGTANGIAAFSYNIWIMNADGTSKTALTRSTLSGRDSLNPRFSPDGASIVFQSKISLTTPETWDATGNSAYNIFLMNVSTGAVTALTQNTLPNLDSESPDFEPALGTKLVFSSRMDTAGAWDVTSSASANLFEINTDGTGLTALTTNTLAYLHSRTPRYSPDGLNIVFSTLSSTGGGMNTQDTFSYNIAQIPSGGGAINFLTTNTSPYLDSRNPAFFPDATGSKVAYESYRHISGAMNTYGTNSSNIWLWEVGPVHTPLTSNSNLSLDSATPQFSPDQITIAFGSTMDTSGAMDGTSSYSSNIFTVPVLGGPVTALTTNTVVGASSQNPVWELTSTTLLFNSFQDLAGTVNGTPALSTNLWTLPAAVGTPHSPLTNHSSSCVSL